MKIYDGPNGKRYVETGTCSKIHAPCKRGTPYLLAGGIVDIKATGIWLGVFPILRLATPEEIAGTEKPGVHLTPESVGKAYRTRGGWKAVVMLFDSSDTTARLCHERPQDTRYFWHEGNGSAPGAIAGADLISEWDEKAEAGGTPEGAATPNACTAKKAASAPPAQPEILPACPCCKGADGFRLDVVDGHLTAIPVFNSKPGDALRVCPECWKPDANAPQGVEPDAPDRRTEHVPVAKAWVNPAMLGR